VNNTNVCPILHSFQVIARISQIVIFDRDCLYLTPSFGMYP